MSRSSCKTCSKCGVEKRLDDFYRDKLKPDGRRSSCKACKPRVERKRPKAYVSVEDKRCSKCGTTKPSEQFYKNSGSKDRLASACKDCTDEARSKRSEEQTRKQRYKYTFGITLEDYERLFAQQRGRCAICTTTCPGHTKHFHVDHCHKTGVVRGLLCAPCNMGIGQLGDDPDRIEAAAAYLRKAP